MSEPVMLQTIGRMWAKLGEGVLAIDIQPSDFWPNVVALFKMSAPVVKLINDLKHIINVVEW